MEASRYSQEMGIVELALLAIKLAPPDAKPTRIPSKSKIRVQDNPIQTVVSTAQRSA